MKRPDDFAARLMLAIGFWLAVYGIGFILAAAASLRSLGVVW